MKTFKIRHVPTGLFYKPSKHRSKANLSKAGKSYSRKPTLAHIGEDYRHPLKSERSGKEFEMRRFKAEDWEIVEFVMVSS